MAELKGTNTEKNLQAAFAGESQAFQKYTIMSELKNRIDFVYIFDVQDGNNVTYQELAWKSDAATTIIIFCVIYIVPLFSSFLITAPL